MAIHVNILILPIFGCPLFKGAKMGPRGQKKLLNLIYTLLVFRGYHHFTLQYLSIEVFYDHICSNIAFTLFGTLFWRSLKGARMGQVGALKLSFYIPICYNSTQYLSLKVSHDYLCKYLTFARFWSLFLRVRKKGQEGGVQHLIPTGVMFERPLIYNSTL